MDPNGSNIFLRYRPGPRLPDVLLGDFAMAESPDDYNWQSATARPHYWSEDTGNICFWLGYLLMSHIKDTSGKWEKWRDHAHPSYSPALLDWMGRLDVDQGQGQVPLTALDLVENLLPVAEERIA